MIDWTQYPNFDRWEFDCKCRRCNITGDFMEVQFLRMLQQARTIAGIGFTITSGMRCAQHNANERGKDSSSHLRGWAADINARGNELRALIMTSAFEVGFRRFGIGASFIHIDCSPSLPTPRIWLY